MTQYKWVLSQQDVRKNGREEVQIIKSEHQNSGRGTIEKASITSDFRFPSCAGQQTNNVQLGVMYMHSMHMEPLKIKLCSKLHLRYLATGVGMHYCTNAQ